MGPEVMILIIIFETISGILSIFQLEIKAFSPIEKALMPVFL
jgi:hypothetical protein